MDDQDKQPEVQIPELKTPSDQPEIIPQNPIPTQDEPVVQPTQSFAQPAATEQIPQQEAIIQTNSVPQPTLPNETGQKTTYTNSPGLIILQWLTYAFWGWTVLAMSILTITVFANSIAGTNDGGFMPYTVAATWVLLPISLICDYFYSKQEPERKVGIASVVMIIHAVLFALFGIGALITIVVCLVQLFTSSSGSNFTQVSLYSAIVITILYAALFIRTLNITKFKWFHRVFIIAMVAIVGVFSVLGFIGPVTTARITRNDSLIDNNLSTIQSSIDTYVSSNNSLPDNLNSIGLTGDSQKLVSDNLVQYIPNTKLSKSNTILPGDQQQNSSTTIYYYQLCVNYKKTSASDGGEPYSSSNAATTYPDSVNTYNHPKGHYCYYVSTPGY